MALKLTDKQKEEIADCLRGTCQSVYDVIEQFDYLHTAPEDDAMDAIIEAAAEKGIACCDTCSWWVEAKETDEDGNCGDCEESLREH